MVLAFVLAARCRDAALAAVGAAHAAPTTIAVRKCSIYACDSAMSLRTKLASRTATLPLGSLVFVSSQQYPLSAFARICPGPRGGRDACLITAGDLGAVELDNEVYARAAAIEPIDIPPDVAPSATQAIRGDRGGVDVHESNPHRHWSNGNRTRGTTCSVR